MTQAVYVTRESQASRTQSLNLIRDRAQSKDAWDQVCGSFNISKAELSQKYCKELTVD